MLNSKKINELYNKLQSTKQPKLTTGTSAPLPKQGENGSMHLANMPGGARLYIKFNNKWLSIGLEQTLSKSTNVESSLRQKKLKELGIAKNDVLNWTTDQGSDNIHASNMAAAQTDITSILNSSLVVGRDSGNQISFGTDNAIVFKADDETELRLNATTLRPHVNDGLALGTTSYQFSDLHLASGGKINWNNSDITLTHSAGSGHIGIAGGNLSLGANDITNVGTMTFGSLSDGSITITDFVDEDNMTSNSATKIPTQQSVKAYVDSEISGLVDSAPGALDTLNELAAALNDDASFSTTITNSLATKLNLSGGSLTGAIDVTSSSQIGIDVESSFSGPSGVRVKRASGDSVSLLANYSGFGGGLSSTDALRFTVNDADANSISSPAMYIETDNKVGIGNTSPNHLLHVGDDVVASFGTAPDKAIQLSSSTNDHEIAYILYAGEGTNNIRSKYYVDDDTKYVGWDSTHSTGWLGYEWKVAGTQQMKLSTSGGLTLNHGGWNGMVINNSANTNGSHLELKNTERNFQVAVRSNGFDIRDVTASDTSRFFINSSGTASFQDNNITNVGDIELDSISSDSGGPINVTLGTDAGDDFIVDTNTLVVEGDNNRVGIGTTSPAQALDVTGNIAVSGTVDGRDLQTDGTKLDGIEANATADQTGPEIASALNTDLGGNFYIGNQSDDMAIFSGAVKAVGTIFAYRQAYPQLSLSDDNGTDKMYIGVSGEHAYIEFMDNEGAQAVNTLRFRGDDQTGSGDYSNADVMTINFLNNRVGIGTTSPSVLTHISADGSSTLPTFGASTRLAVTQTENTGGWNAITVLGGHATGASMYKFGDKDNDQIGYFSYLHEHNRLDTYVNGSHAMSIDSSQNVGIGTTSPSQGLHVVDGGGIVAEFESSDSTTAMVHIENSAGEDGYIGVTNAGLVLSGQDYNSNNMIVDTSGNVGIGTTTPDANLQIHSTSGTKLWLTAAGSNPADAASLRFAESENGTNYIQFSYDGSANELSVDSNNNNDMTVWDRVDNTATHGAQNRFYRAYPQVKYSDDSGTDSVEVGLSSNSFFHKTSDNDINFIFRNSSNNDILFIDSGAKAVMVNDTSPGDFNFKIGDNGRMNMPVRGFEFENAHGYFSPTGDMFLPLFINSTQTDLIRFQPPITFEYWDYSGSAWVDDSSNVSNLKNLLDGRRATSYSLSNTKRKFRFVITRASSWAHEQTFFIENTWSSIGPWSSSATGGGSLTPTCTIERLDGSFDASDDSNNDWTTNAGITTDWHTTGIWTDFGLAMYHSTSLHNSETHVRITITFPEFDSSKTIGLKNIGLLSSYSSVDTNQLAFKQDFDRNAHSYGYINVLSGHDYKINSSSVLNATTLGSGVVNSSLTSVGTLTSLAVSGNTNIDGNLAIGDVNNSAVSIHIKEDSVNARIRLQSTGSNSTSYMRFENDAQNWDVRVDGGNADKFIIRDETTSTNRFEINTSGDATFFGDLTINSPESKLIFRGDDTSMNHEIESDGNLYITVDDDADDSNNFVQFRANSGGTLKNIMKLQDDGDVGIGTDSPARRLDVTDSAIVSSQFASTSANGHIIDLIHNHATDGYNGFRFYEQTDFRLAMSHIQTGTRGYLQVGTNWESGSEIFVVDGDNSRVGIGTASPSEKLTVSGNIAVTGTVDGVDIAARDAVLTSTTTTANAALPKAGGTMTGDLIIAADNKIKSDTTGDHNFIEFDDDSGSPQNQTLVSSVTNVALICDGNNNGTGQFEVLKGGTDSTATELFRVENDGDGRLAGDLTITSGHTYKVGSNDVLNQTTLGSTVVNSSLTSTGALDSGSITSGFGAIDNGSDNITTTGTISFGSLTDGSITITDFVDEDDMASDSAVKIPTQQSVKAYVDANVGGGGGGGISDEDLQDKVGAMFSSNTETGITATYQDADGTIDLVVDDTTKVGLTGNETIAGEKTFSSTVDIDNSVTFKHISLTDSSDDLDVSGCTVVECTPSGTDRLGGLTGGVQGQILYIVKVDSGFGRIFVEHAEGTGNQDIYLISGTDAMLAARAGLTLYCTGSEWIQVG